MKQENVVRKALKVGDKITVNHGSDGNGKLQLVKPYTAVISALYLDGDVKVGSDVFTPAPHGGATPWVTKLPLALARQQSNNKPPMKKGKQKQADKAA